ncbi:MAG TPA: ShlB/FhaC/HecB family hemolysin secretion/activation protein [Coleofasciculaceae cyanobacterium]
MHSKKGLLLYKLLAVKPTAMTGAFSSSESLDPTPSEKQATNLQAGLQSSFVLSVSAPVDKPGGTKRLCWKLLLLYIGIACTGTTSALLFESRCAKAATPTSLSQASEPTEPLNNSENLDRQGLGVGGWGLEFQSPFQSRATELDVHSLLRDNKSNVLVMESPILLREGYSDLYQKTFLQSQNPSTTPPITPPVTPDNLQPNPNQERFPPTPITPTPLAPDSRPSIQSPPSPPTQPPPTPAPQPAPNSQTIQVQKIEVTGSTVFGSDQFNPIVQPYQGRSLTVEQLREVADKITQLYLDQGYITSRAILVDQAITNGTVQIRVIEGSLEQIQVEGTKRLNPDYVRSRIQLGAGTPINTAKLEDQLRLLKADPLFENVEASLRAGTGLGKSILIVRVIEANPFEGSVGVDNFSPPSVGSERLGITALYRNLTGNGDAIAGSYYHTTRGGADNLEFSYRLPVNSMNGAIQLRTALTWNKIVDPEFLFLGLEGNSQLYEIFFQQPLVRTPREEFALSLGFTSQDSQSVSSLFPEFFRIPGSDAEGFTRTRVFRFGQDYVRRDVTGAWSLRSLFSFGVGILGATTNPSPIPDGRFFSWLGQVQRVQILNQNNLLILGADIQLTPDSLFPSQQFVIGGGQSLRGYRQNIRAGDNGIRFSMEDRITLQRDESGAATFQLAPFFDAGYVWNVEDNPTNSSLPSQRFLAGLGFGIIWEPQPRLNIRFDYAYPLIDLKDRGENAQDQGIYFSVRYRF